jgi:hypothetical protein
MEYARLPDFQWLESNLTIALAKTSAFSRSWLNAASSKRNTSRGIELRHVLAPANFDCVFDYSIAKQSCSYQKVP